MVIKRNDPCPCGSGKKYKKCCLQKDNAIQLKQEKQKRFFELKHELVLMTSRFTYSKLTFKEEHALEKAFRNRLNVEMKKDIFDSFFQFYLLFFHEYENKQRGIEWFYEERGDLLNKELKELAHTWTSLTPTLIKVVNHDEKGIMVEKYPSNETVFLPYSEAMPNVNQGKVTLALLEPLDNEFYLNGVTAWAVSSAADAVRSEIERLIAETGKTYNQIVIDYYPELISIIIKHTNEPASSGENEPKQMIQEKMTDTTTKKEASSSQTAERGDEAEINEGEIPYFKQLGFTPETAAAFYGQDVVDFFIEKTDGKTERTIAKYENGMRYLVEYLSTLDEGNWDNEILVSLEQLISEEQLDRNNNLTKTQKKELVSTVNAFIKWIEKRYSLRSLELLN